MKRGRISAMIGIVAVIMIAFGYICFCRESMNSSRTAEENDTDEKMTEEWKPLTLAQGGYAVYQNFPQNVQKLVDTNLFNTPEYSHYEEGEDDYYWENYTEAERKAEKEQLAEEYAQALENLKQIGSKDYLETTQLSTVSESGAWEFNLSGVLKYDSNTNRFTEPEKIAMIENCGFPEFTAVISELEERTKRNEEQINSNANNEFSHTLSLFSVYYPGVTFQFQKTVQGDFRVSLNINYSGCYAPAKYQSIINGVTEKGSYFLYSSCVGEDKDVLVFCRSNSIYAENFWETAGGKYNEKKLALVFEGGKLTDFYVTTSNQEMELDDADREILDVYAKGTGKSLSDKAVSYANKYIYRAK